MLIGCVRVSNGVWYFHESDRPEGWPTLTKVGKVEAKTYPAYRQAIVADDDIDPKQNRMFSVLFEHIKDNEIPMTAPVDMTYENDAANLKMKSMAFLYDDLKRHEPGKLEQVTVVDVPEAMYLSVGVRGGYNQTRFERALKIIDNYLKDNPGQYNVIGPPRYLGYNSPFVPGFWRYGEAQLPVERVELPED